MVETAQLIMEQNILKLLEEGDSAAIRLGHQLLSAVEHPEDPALVLWKEVFLMVDQAGETEMFLHHLVRIVVWESAGLIVQIMNRMDSAESLKWPTFKPVFEMLVKAAPDGRLKMLAEEVLGTWFKRTAAEMIPILSPEVHRAMQMLDEDGNSKPLSDMAYFVDTQNQEPFSTPIVEEP